VPVIPEAYDAAADGLIDFLIEALDTATAMTDEKPAFDDPDDKLKAYLAGKDEQLTSIQVANLFIAVGYKMHERARVSMAEADLGGEQFDDDVKGVEEAVKKYALPQQISVDERDILDTSVVTHTRVGSLKRYRTGTKLLKMHVRDTGNDVSVHTTYVLRAPAKRAVAYYMGWTQLFYARTDKGASPVTIVERENDHSTIARMIVKMPYPFQDREIVSKILWEKVGDGEYFVSQTSCTHPAHPVSSDIVRMDFIRTFNLKQISATKTSVTAIGHMHLGGSFPASINNAVTIPLAVNSAPSTMLYFTAVRPEHEYDDGDSTELGLLVIHRLYPHRTHPDTLRSEINEMISIVTVLRSCQAKYRFLDEFLFHIVLNNVKKGAAQTRFTVNSPLDVITANEAGQVARSFVMLLMSNVNGESAVDEYIHLFPALTDMDNEFAWFRPSMVAIATELMSKVAYGVKVRAGRRQLLNSRFSHRRWGHTSKQNANFSRTC
jgi:hypothetical protein